MSMSPPGIYQPCDIRGNVAYLSPSLYHSWGRTLGQRLPANALFLVGGDVRPFTPVFKEALIKGLLESDIEVIDLGILPTPMIHFAVQSEHAFGCAIVTASHSPAGVNGLKWMVGGLPPDEDQVRALERDADIDHANREGSSIGYRRSLDISSKYQDWLRAAWEERPQPVGARFILDPGNGCWSVRAVAYLRYVFPGAHFSAIHNQADGTFPNRSPDCSRAAYIERLAYTVRDRKADMGIAFDGDGDRVAFVDREGNVLTAEESAWILLHSFNGGLQGRHFVYDCKFSDRVAEAAASLGGWPVPERSGHAFIRRRMIETRALFGAEISGHYFYGDLHGGDDGLFTACRMIVHMAEQGKSLSDLRRACPAIFMTPDLRLSVELGGHRQAIIREIQSAFADHPQRLTDGVRIDFANGWGLVRRSVTDSKQLTFRFEGDSEGALEQVVRSFCDALPRLGAELYRLYKGEL